MIVLLKSDTPPLLTTLDTSKALRVCSLSFSLSTNVGKSSRLLKQEEIKRMAAGGHRDPYIYTKELIDPALKGTLNVLGSCTKSPTVKRVVLTSSMAAVECIGRPQTPNEITDETWFSDPEFCKENKLWYHLSKTLAEDVAWKFAKEKCIDMVVINPSMVIGPLLQPTLNASSAAILELINGSQTYPNVSYGWINVKDVANAHIQAYEIPSASRRYCLVERVAHFSEVVKILHELYPSFQLPKKLSVLALMFRFFVFGVDYCSLNELPAEPSEIVGSSGIPNEQDYLEHVMLLLIHCQQYV
ncbi:Tetraketide alpha-pyrone reductase 2 [Camellia lanceoleosa]|uniref:Tetraketide alpha-pyrone reductase 2 n=1 Tax=Camellia lanceoleosa TaxID=1840588 RepID=A0ACC0F4H4_9ERIC|nr:Tetraketide alpha-pyrone reductase 2 [Camellia lanceoleosa]